MKRTRSIVLFLAAVFSLAQLLYGCGENPNNPSAKTVSSLSVSPTSVTLLVGSSEGFSATAAFTDGTSGQVIPAWSATPSLGRIVVAGFTGVFIATAEGTAQISAFYSGKTAYAQAIINSSGEVTGLATIEIDPVSVQTYVNTVQEFNASGLTASGESIPIAPVWSITGDNVGTFSSTGTVATLETTAQGKATISCSSGEVVGNSYVTVEGFSVDVTVEVNAYVDSSTPEGSFPVATSLKAGYLQAGSTNYEAYLKFPVDTAIPANASIEAATLGLYIVSSGGTTSYQIYNLTSVFSGATTWNARPTFGSFLLSCSFTAGQYNSITNDSLLASVRSWYATPASNFGFDIKQDGSDNGVVVFTSLENGSNPPMLNVQYVIK